MPIPAQLTGRCTQTAALNTASITSQGALVVAPYAYDEAAVVTLDSSGVAKNLFPPVVGRRLVLTGLYLTAKKNITTDVLIDVYQADSLASTTVDTQVFPIEMLKSTTRDFPGLNIRLTEGKFLNAKSDDEDVIVTATGYYVPAT